MNKSIGGDVTFFVPLQLVCHELIPGGKTMPVTNENKYVNSDLFEIKNRILTHVKLKTLTFFLHI